MLGRVNLVSGHVKTQLIAHDKEVCVSLQRVVVHTVQKNIQQHVCVRRCMTLPSAVREVEETCLRLWAQMDRSECLTSDTWSTAPSSTKTPSTTLSSASAGISRTPTIWPPWPWMAWRCIFRHFRTPQYVSSTNLELSPNLCFRWSSWTCVCRARQWRGSTTIARVSTASPGRLIPRVTSAQQVTDRSTRATQNVRNLILTSEM